MGNLNLGKKGNLQVKPSANIEEAEIVQEVESAPNASLATVDDAEQKLLAEVVDEKTNTTIGQLLSSNFLPSWIVNPEQIKAIVTMGAELGLSPMVACNRISLVKGKISLDYGLVATLLHHNGIDFKWTKDFTPVDTGTLDEEGKPVFKSVSELLFTYRSKVTEQIETKTFSMSFEECELAGWTDKDNWEKMPKIMLRARTMSSGVKACFPWVINNMYTDVELADSAPTEDADYKIVPGDDGEAQVRRN